jgi:hypothetical protein
MQDFDITKMLPRAENKTKSRIYNPSPVDTTRFTKDAIRRHYPELEHKLIRD